MNKIDQAVAETDEHLFEKLIAPGINHSCNTHRIIGTQLSHWIPVENPKRVKENLLNQLKLRTLPNRILTVFDRSENEVPFWRDQTYLTEWLRKEGITVSNGRYDGNIVSSDNQVEMMLKKSVLTVQTIKDSLY